MPSPPPASARVPPPDDGPGAARQVVHLAVPLRLWVVAGVVGLLALVVAVVVILQLEDTRRSIDADLADRLARVERTVTGDVGPAARAAVEDRDEQRRLTRLSSALAWQAAPLAGDLRRRDAGVQLQKSGNLSDNLLRVNAGAQITRSADLARVLLRSDVGGATRDVQGLASSLGAADLPGLSRAVTGVTDELGAQDRLRRLLVRLTSVLGEVRTVDLVTDLSATSDSVTKRIEPLVARGIALLSQTRDLTRQTLDVTRDTNGLTRETRDITRETRDITRETGRHAANLDRKLGGDLPLPSP